MKLEDLIAMADKGYPDGYIAQAFNNGKINRKIGDSLAVFLAAELMDTFDKKLSDADQIIEAVRAMIMAVNQIQDVINILNLNMKVADCKKSDLPLLIGHVDKAAEDYLEKRLSDGV